VCQIKYNLCRASYPHALPAPLFYDFSAVRLSNSAAEPGISACGRRGCPLRELSPAARLAARCTAPPGSGAGSGRSLRGHPHLPAQYRNCARFDKRPSDQLEPQGGARRVIISRRDCTCFPEADGRRGAPRAQAREQLVVNGLCCGCLLSPATMSARTEGRYSESRGKEGGVSS
jgi:hypothetical protein